MASFLANMRDAALKVLALQRGRVFLWLPVAFGAGAAAYLLARFEPSWWVLGPPLFVGWAAVLLMRRLNISPYLINLVLFLVMTVSGASACKLRAEHVDAPVLDSSRSQYRIEAYIVDIVSSSSDEPRLLLAPVRLQGVTAEDTPLRLRVSMRPETFAASRLQPGDSIAAFAILNPPPAPSLPGGYDFARSAWFQGLGGVGMVPGQARHIETAPPPLRLRLQMQLNRLRWTMATRLVRDISTEFADGRAMGGFAAALVSGHQAFVPQTLVRSLRDSGLAHILSISGVHMATIGVFCFFGLRFLLAAIPPLALRWPIKKIAAGFAMACVLIYLAISGAPAPAVRAAVVACVAFIAILIDRRALSLRGLAIAAFIVELVTPEAVIQPGFLMSFSATAALLAFSESVAPAVRELSVPVWVRAIQGTVDGLRLSLLASLVATGATTPFSIAYFNRFTVYGLGSNLFEAPVSTFIVMPALALAAAGGDTPAGWFGARVAGAGLWLIARVADFTAGLPHAVITWPSAPSWVLGLSFAGMMWACLMRGRSRWAGVLVASAILWWPRVAAPDVWIDPQGGNAAVRDGDVAYVLRPRVRQYGYQLWTQHYALAPSEAQNPSYSCHGYGCTPLPGAAYKVAFWFSNKQPKDKLLSDMCAASDLIVLRSPDARWPKSCDGVNRITGEDLKRLGALELTRTPTGWSIRAAQPLRGHRFWSRTSEAEIGPNDNGGSG